MSKNVLYLCPSFPYPADNGGKAVFINHINLLLKNGFKIHGVFLDVDDIKANRNNQNPAKTNFERFEVFSREVPRIKGFFSTLKSAAYFIFNKKPRAFIARQNGELQALVESLIAENRYDHIVFDHFTALAFINNLNLLKSVGAIYISHNFEAKVIREQYQSKFNPFYRLIFYIEYCKTKTLEKKIINEIPEVITISSEDKKELSAFYGNSHIENIPEIIPLKERLWTFTGGKNILFVGGTDYYPNYDAVDWIVKVLMPELSRIDAAITCTIVGNTTNYRFKGFSSNIHFAGRISDDELENLYCSSGLFISPVVLGAGVKVKVLTALSYAIPLLCTRESMLGIDYLDDPAELTFDRSFLQDTISKILKKLNNQDEQVKTSLTIKDRINIEYAYITKKWSLNDF